MGYCLEPCLVIFDYLEFTLALLLRLILDILFLCTSPIWYIIEAYQTASSVDKVFDTILITGASSGIGQACAIEFARRNPKVTLFLLGRNSERLQETKTLCLHHMDDGTESVYCYSVDITHASEIERVINECDDTHKIDLFIANAGIGTVQIQSTDWFERYHQMFAVNVVGTFNCVMPILKRFISRKHGHIAFNASIASYNIIPGNVSMYSATKAFIRFMCQTIRIAVKYYNIDCTVINLGHIDTPLIPPHAKKSAKSKEDAAAVIINGLLRNRSSVHYPFHTSFAMWYIGSLHPVLNACVCWLIMSSSTEPDLVFAKYLSDDTAQKKISDKEEVKENIPLMSDGNI